MIHLPKSKKNLFRISILMSLLSIFLLINIIYFIHLFIKGGYTLDLVYPRGKKTNLVAQEQTNTSSHGDNVAPSVTPTFEEEKMSDYFTTRQVYDPKGLYYSFLNFRRNKETEFFKLELVFSSRLNEHGVIYDPVEEGSYGAWQTQVDESNEYTIKFHKDWKNNLRHKKSLIEDDFHEVVAWNSKGDKAAALMPGKIVLVSFNSANNYKHVLNKGTVNVWEIILSDAIIVKDVSEVSIKWPENVGKELRNFLLFFSGDGRYIYYGVNGDVFRLSLSTQESVHLDEDSFDIHQVPGTSGYTKWLEDESTRLKSIVVIDLNGKSEYLLPESETIDYLGKILISPNLSYACTEWGSSGHWGYAIYKLSSGEEILGGQQYSHCRRWTDRGTVIVEEDLYHSGGTFWFEFNPVTREKRYLDNIGFHMTFDNR